MKISQNCYVIYGLTTIPPWMVNSGFIVGKEKTLVIDCGGNYLSAQTIYGYAKSAKPDNKIIAVNTEPHFDHMGGNCFFNEMRIDIYGHKDISRTENELDEVKESYKQCIAEEFRQIKNEEELVFYKTKVVNPNIAVEKNFTLDLGDLIVDIVLTPGHTTMNLSVYINEDSVLYCGDVIISDYFPNLDDGDKKDWEEWLLSIKKIENISPEIIVPGHGEILEGSKQKEEISRMQKILKTAVANGNIYK